MSGAASEEVLESSQAPIGEHTEDNVVWDTWNYNSSRTPEQLDFHNAFINATLSHLYNEYGEVPVELLGPYRGPNQSMRRIFADTQESMRKFREHELLKRVSSETCLCTMQWKIESCPVGWYDGYSNITSETITWFGEFMELVENQRYMYQISKPLIMSNAQFYSLIAPYLFANKNESLNDEWCGFCADTTAMQNVSAHNQKAMHQYNSTILRKAHVFGTGTNLKRWGKTVFPGEST